MIRYGLIGAGMMGQEHIRNIALLDGAVVSALAYPDECMRASALSEQGGTAREFSDWRAMVSADCCDVYLIASPNDEHHATLMELLPGNRPILCEKPMCTTVTHARQVVAAAARRSAPLWIAMEYRYMPPVQRLSAELEKGTAGPPVMMSIREHRYPFLPKRGNWNRWTSRSGGTLIEKCCHFWDLMRLLLESDPIRVYASAGMNVNHLEDGKGGDVIDNAFVIVDFANGARGLLDLAMFAEGSPWQEVISLVGPKARIEARVPGPQRFARGGLHRLGEVAVADRAERAEIVEVVPVDDAILMAGDHHGSTYFQHIRFLDHVRSGQGRPEVTAEDGLWSVIVGAAAEESARSGRAVETA